mgnify:CR=1 FL=1
MELWRAWELNSRTIESPVLIKNFQKSKENLSFGKTVELLSERSYSILNEPTVNIKESGGPNSDVRGASKG